MKTVNLSEIIKLSGNQHLIIGHSGSGKTTLIKTILENIKSPKIVHIYGLDINEWNKPNAFKKNIEFHQEYPFQDSIIFDLKNSIVIFDDFTLKKKYEEQFHKFCNYNIRHFNITFFLICHSIYKSNLYSKILSSPSIFLTPSQSNLFMVQRYDKMFSTQYTSILKENIETSNTRHRPILYLTSTFAINNAQNLFSVTPTKNIKMFKNDKIFHLLDTDDYEIEESNFQPSNNNLEMLLDEFKELYPKRFKKIKKFIELLYIFSDKEKILDTETLELTINGKSYNLYDFIIGSQNFSKKDMDPKTKILLSYFKKAGFKVPKFTLQNNNYKYYLT